MITKARVVRFIAAIEKLRGDVREMEMKERSPVVRNTLDHASTNLLLAGNAVDRAARKKKEKK